MKYFVEPAADIIEQHHRDGNVTEFELRVLATLARGRKCVLELGTFDGRTTLNLALHCSGFVHTLDLPTWVQPKIPSHREDHKYIQAEKPPRWLKYPNLANKIIQHFGDSATYDFGDLRPDMVFIDACHAAECVRSDTQRMLSILAPGGIIVWHDYGAFAELTAVLDEMSLTMPMKHIDRTLLVGYWNEMGLP